MRAIDRAAAVLDCAATLAAYVLIGGADAPALCAFAALHEASHVAALRAVGVREMRLCSAGIGFRLRYPAARLSLGAVLFVTFAGCAANAAAAIVFAALGAYRLAAVNASLALFNMLPVRGLDAHEALCAVLERFTAARAFFAARAVSLSFAFLLWLFSVFVSLRVVPSPELLLVSCFLLLREIANTR